MTKTYEMTPMQFAVFKRMQEADPEFADAVLRKLVVFETPEDAFNDLIADTGDTEDLPLGEYYTEEFGTATEAAEMIRSMEVAEILKEMDDHDGYK